MPSKAAADRRRDATERERVIDLPVTSQTPQPVAGLLRTLALPPVRESDAVLETYGLTGLRSSRLDEVSAGHMSQRLEEAPDA